MNTSQYSTALHEQHHFIYCWVFIISICVHWSTMERLYILRLYLICTSKKYGRSSGQSSIYGFYIISIFESSAYLIVVDFRHDLSTIPISICKYLIYINLIIQIQSLSLQVYTVYCIVFSDCFSLDKKNV